MNVDALTLQSFIALSETGSFTKAAHRVSRTQSAISQQILKLEKMVGKPLFLRGKTLALTPGARFFSVMRARCSLCIDK